MFLIYNTGLPGCLETKDSLVKISKACNTSTPAQQWKWVSRSRLFNVGAMQCLGVSWQGVNSTMSMQSLATYECDRESINMRWNCRSLGEQLSQYLSTRIGNSSLVLAERGDQARGAQWRTYGTDEDLCSVPYSGKIHRALCCLPLTIHCNYLLLGLWWCLRLPPRPLLWHARCCTNTQ